MKLLADESVDSGIIKNLRTLGIEVFSISEYSPGITDEKVLNLANERNLILITEDKDFGELVHRLKLNHKGILLIRMSNIARNERIVTTSAMIHEFFDKLNNSFSVLTSKGLRIKSLQITLV